MNWAELRAQLACTDRGDEMVVDAWRPQHQRARQERAGLAICADCQHLGYWRHHRNGEEACQPCKTAVNEARRDYRARRKNEGRGAA
jgi:hypothetical protein